MIDAAAFGSENRQVRRERVAPRASMLIESMRDIGYTLLMALADLIDNSITAGARSIELLADTTSDNPSLAVLDDGRGMSETELIDAMRPGSQSPLVARDTSDLGRFGLGLKTASFSQCRRLTVVSRTSDSTVCARWDLDAVARDDDWLVEIPDSLADVPWADRLGARGTVVVWEKMDRLLPDGTKVGRESLVRQIDEASEHLELVFHRFLAGEPGLPKVSISLNGRKLQPYDPFCSRHVATQAGPVETVRMGDHDITIQAFTLPHHKKVTQAEWERNAGKEGYLRNQGFYVYRGKRLIIHGTWFGLARQTEVTRLARVRIDMPNGLDAEWKIDVKKAWAQPPAPVRERLRRIIEEIGATSKRIYRVRGHRLISESRLPVWLRLQDKNEISYALNNEHPVFAGFAAKLQPSLQAEFRQVLAMAAAAIPVDTLFADASGHPELISSNKLDDEVLRSTVETTVTYLKSQGIVLADIREMLEVTEPFKTNWASVSKMLSVSEKEGSTDA